MKMAKQRKPEMGKFLLWRFFYQNARVRRYLPETKRYGVETFKEMLTRFRSAYVKPVAGSRGRGVLKVWQQDGNVFVQKTVFRAKAFPSVEAAIRFIDAQRKGKAYIVQQPIHLAKVDGRPFDIRVMMQRERMGGKWLYSGMLAKIAGKGSIVTNVALSKGSVMSTKEALRRSLGWDYERIDRCIEEVIGVCFAAARHFDSYLLYRELGFDMAIDQSGRMWMIEQNTLPSHPLFAHLTSNLSMHRTIQQRWMKYATSLKRSEGIGR